MSIQFHYFFVHISLELSNKPPSSEPHLSRPLLSCKPHNYELPIEKYFWAPAHYVTFSVGSGHGVQSPMFLSAFQLFGDFFRGKTNK